MRQSAAATARLGQAMALHRQNRLSEAEPLYRSVLDEQPANADAHHLLGVLRMQSGRPHRALGPLERAVELDPHNAQFHANLGRAHYALGHHEQALSPLRRAADLAPDDAEAWCDLGAVLQDADEDGEAERVYRHAIALAPRLARARYNLATLLNKRGRLSEAIALMREVCTQIRDHPSAHTLLTGYLLQADRVEESLASCDRAFAANPRDLMAMTFRSLALLRAGDRAGARRLVDLERLIDARMIAPPEGHADLDAFNRALEEHVLAHPTLEHERRQNATRNGRHTDNLLRDAEPGPMEALARIFDAAVRRYLRALPDDPSHPYLAWRPSAWRLQSWAVVMHAQGHQLAHTHPDGWVSGVYYARVPPVVREHDASKAGWIAFGRPLPELIGDAEPDVRMLRPRAGMLVLFPSYFYHETVPFEASEHRISIAFDACPSG